MPIVKPRSEQMDTPELMDFLARNYEPVSLGPEQFATDRPELDTDDGGFFGWIGDIHRGILTAANNPNNLVAAHLRRSGVVSGLLTSNMLEAGWSSQVDQTFDPNFDVNAMITTDFKQRYPYLQERFANNDIPDFPNEDAFWNWVEGIERDFEDREAMSQHGFFANMAAMTPALMMDGFVAGTAFKAFKLTKTANTFSKAYKASIAGTDAAGSATRAALMGRRARQAITFGALNLAQEEMLRAVNPDRNVDEVEAAIMAFATGTAFGAAIPAFVFGYRATHQKLAVRKIQKFQKQTIEYFALPQANTARELIEQSTKRLQDLLDGKAELPDTIDAVVTPETRPLIQALSEKYPDARFARHPDQNIIDWYSLLNEREKMTTLALQAKGTNRFSQEYANLVSMWSPGSKIRGSVSSLARRYGRTIFDDSTATIESAERPLTNTVVTPAEALKWNLDNELFRMSINMNKHLREATGRGKNVKYTYYNGTSVQLGRNDHGGFGRATIDYMRRSDTAARRGTQAPDAPPAIQRAADEARAYYKLIEDEATLAGLLKNETGPRQYLPQRWKWWAVQGDRDGYISRIYRAAMRNREEDFYTGKKLTEQDREIIDDVWDFKRDQRTDGRGLNYNDREAIRAFIQDDGKRRQGVTEAELREAVGDDVMSRYLEEVEVWNLARSKEMFDTIVHPDNRHGVAHAMATNDVFKRRMLEIDQEDFADYLVNDMDHLVAGYHTKVAGQIAVRQALKNDAELIAILKQKGVDLEKADYDPRLVLDAIKKDFTDEINLHKQAGRPDRAMAAKKDQDKVLRILEAKTQEITGGSLSINDPTASAGWRLFEKVSLRLPAMAFLGKVTASSMTDLAAHAFTKGLTRRHIKQTIKSINLLREVPDYGLEALYVANSDTLRATRTMLTYDLDNLGDMQAYGPGLKGSIYEGVDRTTEAATNTFFKLTGMNRWNRNQKRHMATLHIVEFLRGAQLMARAQRLMRDGVSESDAIAKVGLSPEDARLLNRLGINGSRSERLMETVSKYGAALDLRDGAKQKWSNQAEFEKFLADGKGYVSPEFYAWRSVDRDLFDAFTSAINRHVQDLIVEPKLMSRPLFNNKWIGRAFNQFQAFSFAWGNQHMQMAAQRPLREQGKMLMYNFALGAMVDAIHNQLSGRRSFAETAEQWVENPEGMVYGAINRSALTGWLARPIGLADQTPWGPGRMLGNEQLTGTYSRPIEPTGFLLGPFGSWADNLASGAMLAAYEGRLTDKRQRQLWNAAPYHNLWSIETAIRAAEAAGVELPQFTRPAERR